MAQDSGESRVADLRERLGVDKSHVQTYRQRLIEAGVIHPTGHGQLAFSVPYLAQYLRENQSFED